MIKENRYSVFAHVAQWKDNCKEKKDKGTSFIAGLPWTIYNMKQEFIN